MTVNQIDGGAPAKPQGSPYLPPEEPEAELPKTKVKAKAKAEVVEVAEAEEPQVRATKKVETKDVSKVLDDWADDGDE
jgi:hypothetical protein